MLKQGRAKVQLGSHILGKAEKGRAGVLFYGKC